MKIAQHRGTLYACAACAMSHKPAFPFSSPETAFFGHFVLKRGVGYKLSRIVLRMRMEHSRPLSGEKIGSGALARAEAGSAQNF